MAGGADRPMASRRVLGCTHECGVTDCKGCCAYCAVNVEFEAYDPFVIVNFSGNIREIERARLGKVQEKVGESVQILLTDGQFGEGPLGAEPGPEWHRGQYRPSSRHA